MCECGCDWWIEVKVIRLAGSPAARPQTQSTAREYKFQLRCAECLKPHPEHKEVKNHGEKETVKNQESQTAVEAKAADVSVASQEANESLEHSEGGETTRTDKTDLGVPMLPGSPDEPQGPEDALGEGPKRGDYTNRLGGTSYNPHEANISQKPRVEEIGDVAGKKGGVETAEEAKK